MTIVFIRRVVTGEMVLVKETNCINKALICLIVKTQIAIVK